MEDTSSSICNSYTELAEVFRMTGGLLFRGLTSAQEYVHFVQPVLQLQLKFRSISRQSSQRGPQQYKKIHFNVNFIGFEYTCMNNCCFSMNHCNSPLQNNQFAGRAALKKVQCMSVYSFADKLISFCWTVIRIRKLLY